MTNEMKLGARVHVFSVDEEDLGLGTYLGEASLDAEVKEEARLNGVNPEGVTTPRIKLDSGEFIYGDECWWHPVED